MRNLISIIVPIYNTEKYLDECIQSVLAQSYKDWELLLVNDGSTDKSPFICDRYASSDIRIRVIHKENTGVSDSRNRALDVAKGKYVIFLDSDDYWYDNTALEQLIAVAERYDLDIVRGEYKAVDENGKDLFIRTLIKSKTDNANKIIGPATFLKNIICGEFFSWLCLIKRIVFENIRFNVNRCYLEDMELISRLMLKPLNCMFIPLRFYAYRKLVTSASNKPSFVILENSFSMCDFFQGCSLKASSRQLKDCFAYYSIMKYYWSLKLMAQTSFYYDNYESYLKKMSINQLHRRICKWITKVDCKYYLYIYLSPHCSIKVMRIKYVVSSQIRKILETIGL